MPDQETATPAEHAARAACDQVRQYLELEAEHGTDRARQIAVNGLVRRQADRIGPLIEHAPLAAGLGTAAPGLEAIGISTEFVDDSTEGEDAAVEVMLTCTCVDACRRLGLAEARPVLCDLDLAATEKAVPGLRTQVLARQTDGRKVCVFRFSRPGNHDHIDDHIDNHDTKNDERTAR